jgi:anti-sigma factor RsiW
VWRRRIPDGDPWRFHAAVYVLGALSPSERRAFHAHIRVCAECHADVVSLASLPGLLGRLTVEDVADS